VVLDGILGLGGRLPLEGPIAEVLDRCREMAPPQQRRIAVDVPSGVLPDTGAADERAFRAHLTLCTGPAKVGLFIHPGAACAGRVQALEIGLPAGGVPALWRLDEATVAGLLPVRPDDSNKGTYGKVLVVAGSARYVGAAALAAGAAVRAGAGLVTLAVPATVQRAVAGASPEATYLPLPDDPHGPGLLHPGHADAVLEAAFGYDALAIGPGVGDHPQTQRLVLQLAARLAGSADSPPVVFDADALNALAASGEWPRPQEARWVLTPHPGEMGRLRRRSVAEVQGDRLETARSSARDWGQVVVLKGAPSIIAAPDGRACLNAFANAALATAGTGDVLTGTIAGLIAQGMEPFSAAGAGSYLHGLAGELWRARHGAGGLPASHLLALLPDALRRLRSLRWTPVY
jgi:NAD(P)H-hydrate epimerase